MAKGLFSNTFSLVGGATIGAALMYLFDPDQGEQRRSDVASTTSDAVSSTGDALHASVRGAAGSAKTAAGHVSDYAQDVAGHVSEHAGHMADHASSFASSARSAIGDVIGSGVEAVRGLTSKASKTAKGYASSAHSAVHDAIDSGSDTAHWYSSKAVKQAKAAHDDLFDRASAAVSRGKKSVRQAAGEESHPISTATGITAGAVGVLVVGAGLMYFLDPERGRARRARASDRLSSFTRQTGHQARGYGRHLGNQLKGRVYEAKRYVPEQWTQQASTAIDKAHSVVSDAVSSAGSDQK